LLTLSTGSIVGVIGAPHRAEPRYWDAPLNSSPRADAWFWTCGCAAEPAGPGKFNVASCADHHEKLTRRFEHKARFSSPHYVPSLPRILPG